jgi:hypothetical protein
VAGQWHEATSLPRWAEWANWGFGEPRFLFYPPLSWLIGAALGSLLPWPATPGAYIWLTLIVGGMAMWRLAREWLPEGPARAAAVLFAVNPYNLAIVYYRSDFSELLALAFLPLLLRGALQVTGGEWRRVPQLALLFAAIWLTNAPEGVIATYSLVLLLITACILQRSPRPLLPGAAAMAAGFGLAALYILPAAWERNWVQISQALSANLQPERNFLFTQASDPEFQLFNWKISGVALLMILLSALAAVFAVRRRGQSREISWMLLVLGAASVVVMFRPSALLWRHLPELAFLQFPWRWLGPLAVVFAFFAATAISVFKQRWKSRLTASLILAAVAVTGMLMATNTWWSSEDARFLAGEIRSGHGYEGVDEYQPGGSDRYSLPGATPDAQEVPTVPPTPRVAIFDSRSGGGLPSAAHVKLSIQQWSGERKAFSTESPESVTLAVRLINYPAWEVRVDGSNVAPESAEMTAQMLVPIPPGAHRVEIRFRRTWDRSAGGAISILSAVGLVGFALILRRPSRATGAGGA